MASPDPDRRRDDALPDAGDALWHLLGRARRVEASPYFVRKVLRAVESESEPRLPWWRSLLQSFAPAAACAGVAVLALAGMQRGEALKPMATADIEFETIQSLDLLVSNYESSLWLDSYLPSR